ncbi:unnamed protein product [Larinioides sclopetarius]|uniref:EGF-like domain-containing protein n=1 Tax=Larinioides sclopetarius TaxID=280406 RepID=A0AAV2BL07_9ARAC
MEKTIIFSITVVLCFGKFITSAAEVSEIDVSISQTETVNYIPVDTAVNKEFHFNGSELGMARADQCKCKNGKCMRACDIEKTTSCEDQRMVCVCNPEFAKQGEGECEYCDCGQGFNCTFKWAYNILWEKTCICPDGYFFNDIYSSKCIPCLCENGYCDYEYVKYNRKLVCRCFSGYKNFNGYCKECTCGSGECEFNSNGQKICKCLDGFYEKEGICKTCDCHSLNDMKTKCELTGNTKRCFCQKGFKDVLGHCEDINECETNNTCHPSATCYNIFGGFFCRCPNDYEGTDGEKVEPGEVCEDIDECDKSPNHCWFFDNVKCVNLPGSYKCECFQGYEPRTYSDEPHQTTCVRTSKNVGPAMIVVGTTLVLMLVSYLAHVRVKKRAARSN